jgi:Ni,Fe-hydrogenase III component G
MLAFTAAILIFNHIHMYCIFFILDVYRYSCRVRFSMVRYYWEEVSRQIFERYSDMKFQENPSTGSRVVPCGHTDRETDLTKLIVVFLNFEDAPKYIVYLKYKLPILFKFNIGVANITAFP